MAALVCVGDQEALFLLFRIQSGGLWIRTPPTKPSSVGPALYKGEFSIADKTKDTFADMQVRTGWSSQGGGGDL